MNRRFFVWGLPATGAVLWAAPACADKAEVQTNLISARKFALRVISDRRSARALALLYAERFPAQSIVALENDLATRLDSKAQTLQADAGMLASTFITSDFETSHTVHLDGWILSRTEVALCLLASFKSPIL
jgi:hypothetical protein